MEAKELRETKIELIKAGIAAKISLMQTIDVDEIKRCFEVLRDEEFMFELYAKKQGGEE